MRAGFWTNARLLTTAVLLVMTAVTASPAQDWIPFQAAERLARAAEWEAVYPPAGAGSLFDVTERYRDVARSMISQGGQPAFAGELLTAFLSSPPAAFAAVPFSRLSWQSGTLAWRLTLAIPVVLSLLLVGASATNLQSRARWSWICLAAAPVLCYAVYIGQPSSLLFVVAAMSMLPATLGRDMAGGVALGLGVIFKATPILVIAGLWMCGRRRLAAIAAATAAIACVATLPFVGNGWAGFFATVKRLATVGISDWNNASFDAALLRLTAGTTSLFTEPGTLVIVMSWLLRLVVAGLAVRAVIDGGRAPARRAAAVWIGWLAATPVLWLHYLVALVPLAGAAPARRVDPGALLVAATGIVLAGRIAGVAPVLCGMAACGVWLASAAWLLSNRCWNTE
ncbi:MAG TPA: glycosyltransferase family 87 protein [Vicinamibacterales bacterium]|nr:glycosyltransferase family 87 protein [Vicinamibacterales bacterium]